MSECPVPGCPGFDARKETVQLHLYGHMRALQREVDRLGGENRSMRDEIAKWDEVSTPFQKAEVMRFLKAKLAGARKGGAGL